MEICKNKWSDVNIKLLVTIFKYTTDWWILVMQSVWRKLGYLLILEMNDNATEHIALIGIQNCNIWCVLSIADAK